MTQDEKNGALFMSLVAMFQAACMQHLGKVKNPATDAIERDLQQAQLTIDLLDMLAERTKQNLSPPEEKMLREVIRELKLNFVDEISKKPADPDKKESAS